MRAFLDTNVLIAVFQGEHPDHQASLKCLTGFEPNTGCCGGRSLAKVYSSLTLMPSRQRVTADTAMLFIDNIRERLSTIALTGDEYVEALKATAEPGITGGSLYDVMLAQCALKSGADVIYIWNGKHYAQCGPGVVKLLRTRNCG